MLINLKMKEFVGEGYIPREFQIEIPERGIISIIEEIESRVKNLRERKLQMDIFERKHPVIETAR